MVAPSRLLRDPDTVKWTAAAPAERQLRVMHLVYFLGFAGTELAVVRLLENMEHDRYWGAVASCSTADSGLRTTRHVDVYEFGPRGEGNNPRVVTWLYQLFRRQRPDIVHTHAWGTLCEGVVAARLAGVPIVVHGEHGTLETRRRNVPVQRWVWNRVDQVLSVSSRLADRMADVIGFPRERIVTIPNGVDLERFKPGGAHEAKRALGLHENELVIGTAGRLVPVKDHQTLLTAWSILKQRGIRFRGVVAGCGPLEADLRLKAVALGLEEEVRWLGNRPDIEAVLRAMDVFVLSSRSEGLSNTILEAMASRVPVIATRVGGADELIVDAATGMLVPSQDPDALADAMTTLALDQQRRAAIGLAGQRRAESEFSVRRMIERYDAVYRRLARRHGLLSPGFPVAARQRRS